LSRRDRVITPLYAFRSLMDSEPFAANAIGGGNTGRVRKLEG